MKIAIILCILLTSMLAWAETFRDDFEDGGFCINPLYIILTKIAVIIGDRFRPGKMILNIQYKLYGLTEEEIAMQIGEDEMKCPT